MKRNDDPIEAIGARELDLLIDKLCDMPAEDPSPRRAAYSPPPRLAADTPMIPCADCGEKFRPHFEHDARCWDCNQKARDRAREKELREIRLQRDRDRHERDVADARAALPKLHAWATFEHPDLGAWVKDPSAVERVKSMLDASTVALVGPPGVGKTTLACAMANAMFAAGSDVSAAPNLRARAAGLVFATAIELGEATLSSKLGDERAKSNPLRADALEATVLVLDDVGQEATLPQSRDAVREVLHLRYLDARQTIVTCGLTVEQLGARYDGGTARRIWERGRVDMQVRTGRVVRAVKS